MCGLCHSLGCNWAIKEAMSLCGELRSLDRIATASDVDWGHDNSISANTCEAFTKY